MEEGIRNTDSKSGDINQVVEFQEKFVLFQNKIENVVRIQIDFWHELDQLNSSTQKLLVLGGKITAIVDAIKESYIKLLELNPNHVKLLVLYGDFVKHILNDNVEGQRILEK